MLHKGWKICWRSFLFFLFSFFFFDFPLLFALKPQQYYLLWDGKPKRFLSELPADASPKLKCFSLPFLGKFSFIIPFTALVPYKLFQNIQFINNMVHDTYKRKSNFYFFFVKKRNENIFETTSNHCSYFKNFIKNPQKTLWNPEKNAM